MRLLLDTHVVLWAIFESHKLKPAVRRALANAEPVVSIATVWEAAIKISTGRLGSIEALPDRLAAAGVEVLPISMEHAWHVRTLPPLHGDPFDRLIVAQAEMEHLTLVTHDRRMADYGIAIIRA